MIAKNPDCPNKRN